MQQDGSVGGVFFFFGDVALKEWDAFLQVVEPGPPVMLHW